MKLSVIGSGYVGLVTGVCFADLGHEVICADNDQRKIDLLLQGKSPIYEPGLEELILKNIATGRLSFTSNVQKSIEDSEVIFIAVGTPPNEDGSADLKHVLAVAKTIGQNINSPKTIVVKSTVPVGTCEKVKNTILENLIQKHPFYVVSNPEFLKEGSALEDCFEPARIVVGVDCESAEEVMKKVYAPLTIKGFPIFVMGITSSELTKYAANSMLATKITFMNELSNLCEKVGADIESIREGIGSDPRIGDKFLYAGIGYGGSCFPKDVKALINTSNSLGINLGILQAVDEANYNQREIFFKKIKDTLGTLKDKKIAIWGLAFKPNTDDIRDAPSIFLIEKLLELEAKVFVYDPVAVNNVKAIFGSKIIFGDMYSIVESADALCIVTEWEEFKKADLTKIEEKMPSKIIFDGRNIFPLEKMSNFKYFSIGRS